jgi:indole-3-glycerol phosphate synthase
LVATTYLDRILEAHRARAADDHRPIADLAARAAAAGPTRGFARALRGEPQLAVVCEIKRRSPSKGDLAPDLDPAELARSYESGGGRALSVLTDRDFFGGSPHDLELAREACRLPVLRKDFTVSERDVYDARIMGADAVLLIVAALDDVLLEVLLGLSRRLGLDALVEVHDESELERALALGVDTVGVNQRDLVTFEVDHDRALRLASLIPDTVVRVAESGIDGPGDARRLADAGYDAILVGESLVTADDPAVAVEGLCVPRAGR